MKKTLLALGLAMLSYQAMALPVPVTQTLPIEPPAAQAVADPEPERVEIAPAPVAEPFPAANLWKTVKSLQLGPQSGITKVLGAKKTVAWTRGFDDQKVARISVEERRRMFDAMGVPEGQLVRLSQQLMEKYPKLPHAPTAALLGAIALEPALPRADGQRIEDWLNRLLTLEKKDVITRRQALLALALLPQASDQTVATMLKVYETSKNNWETFPVNQFVQYHAGDLWDRDDAQQLRQRLGAVESLYTPGIVQDLAQQEPPVPSAVLETEAATQ